MNAEQFILRVIIPAYEKNLNKNTYSSFLWYRGTRSDGDYKVFRMVKGVDSEIFKRYIINEGFVDITGPWESKKAATERLR